MATTVTFDYTFFVAENYEELYNRFLEFFKGVYTTDDEFILFDCPLIWRPLLISIGAKVKTCSAFYLDTPYFRTEFMLKDKFTRFEMEVICAARTELTDALFKIQTEWVPSGNKLDGLNLDEEADKMLPITTNNGFYRLQYLEFMTKAAQYTPTKPFAVVMPCSAIKPYPAPIHKRVMDVLEELNRTDAYEIVAVSGTLGAIPQGLWAEMPLYDAGVPNFQRVEDTLAYFLLKYRRVVVYDDFYSQSIAKVVSHIPQLSADFPLGIFRTTTYENLFDRRNIARLKVAL